MMLSYSLFALVTVSIVANGLRSGLERAVKFLIPLLFGLLILLAVYTAINADIIAGAKFLFRPDFSKITGSVVLIALGQAFFSLSIGIGASLAFGAYIPKEMSIPSAIAVVVAADTLIAVLAGLVLFPLVLNYGLMPGEGPSLVFITLPIAFAQMPGGNLFGTFFFLLLALAALTTSIAMMEPCVSWLTQTTKMRRSIVAVLVGLAIWAGGIPALLSFNLLSEFNPLAFLRAFEEMTFFDVMEFTTTTVLLPTCGLLIALFAGWVLPSNVFRNSDCEPSMYFKIWRFLVRYIAPIGIMSLFLSQLASIWA
jgi:NSS family neurotransmitter:Na+ symporter